MTQTKPDLSVIIVSYNTRRILRECLNAVGVASRELKAETIVIDNASEDGSPEMVRADFPEVELIRSEWNRGFAGANNLGFEVARGRYIVLLNSDAILCRQSLSRTLEFMEEHPDVGLAGAQLVGRDGSWQPSHRRFPSPLNDFLHLTGLAARFPRSRFFGRADHTFDQPEHPCPTDWVPGAFSIIRQAVLDEVGFFDPQFFLYFEEVDLCRRIRAAGYRIFFLPNVRVIHIGGESSKQVDGLALSSSGAQLLLWRMRSGLLYYRKHHGTLTTRAVHLQEFLWHWLRSLTNSLRGTRKSAAKRQDSQQTVRLLKQAWSETLGGRVAPPVPW